MNFFERVRKTNQIKKLTKKIQVFLLEGKFISQDNITMDLGIQLCFHVEKIDVFSNCILVEDMEQRLKDIFREIANEEIKKVSVEEIWDDFMENEAAYREKYQRRIQYRMEEKLAACGVCIDKLELVNCKLPDEMKDAWQKMKKAQAEREKMIREKK